MLASAMFSEVSRRNILRLAEAYGAATGRSLNSLSLRFYSNGTFFRELKARRRSVSVDKMGEILADFANSWPKGVPWPDLEPIYFSKENLTQQRFVMTNQVNSSNAPQKKR